VLIAIQTIAQTLQVEHSRRIDPKSSVCFLLFPRSDNVILAKDLPQFRQFEPLPHQPAVRNPIIQKQSIFFKIGKIRIILAKPISFQSKNIQLRLKTK
jgi:hypothetical protein